MSIRKRIQSPSKRWILSSLGFVIVALALVLVAAFPPGASAQGENPTARARSFLSASLKQASQSTLAPGETLTYTISLYNTGTEPANVTVIDPLPEELAYLDGSSGAEYSAGEVTWKNVSVASNETVELTFTVEIATDQVISAPTRVVNIAEIQVAGVEGSIFRKETIVLVPEPTGSDNERPVVNSLVIGDRDLYQPGEEVTLYIDASDNEGVAWMYIREWQLVTDAPLLRWEVAQNSGWVPYSAELPWTLAEADGVHFVSVKVADSALNRSRVVSGGLDYANVVVPDAALTQPDWVPFVVFYDPAVTQSVSATLTPAGGDADLYLWTPENFAAPDQTSANAGDDVAETIDFTVTTAGSYIIMVHNKTALTYNISIVPDGGPAPANLQSTAGVSPAGPTLMVEPIFTIIGRNPLGFDQQFGELGIATLHLPLVKR